MVRLDFYSATDLNRKAVEEYQLTDTQFTGMPVEVIEECSDDPNRYPMMIMDDNRLVGFFCLHKEEGPAMYGLMNDKILLRGYSIDSRYRKKGYAKRSFQLLVPLVMEHFPDITGIVLGVNHANIPAQKTYQSAGFYDTGLRREGRKGELFIYELILKVISCAG
jgi:RimJ/RimL family protein N-acetyltransferase